jgi:hypothetical protein
MQLVITSIDFTKKITVTNALSFVLFERVIVVSIIDLSSIFITEHYHYHRYSNHRYYYHQKKPTGTGGDNA